MKCQKCDNPATIHLTEIVNDLDNSIQKKELHLCEECAREHELNIKDGLSITDLVLDWPDMLDKSENSESVACPVCGWTMERFRTEGKFGCANDYALFRDDIQSVLRRLHNDTVHCGKQPAGDVVAPEPGVDLQADLMRMETDLRDAIAKEAYEEAARIRDEIKALKECEKKA